MFFQFKQFSIKQEDSAMKVGTDGLLLATSTPLSKPSLKMLDVGSGTGLISLVIAQRAPKAMITAIEIEKKAAEESAFNFAQSPFAERLKVKHTSFQDLEPIESYDLIISNPPFFKGSQAVGDRSAARDSDSLPAEEFFKAADQMLAADGQLSLIIPFANEGSFLEHAEIHRLFPFHIMRIRGRKESKIIRSILHFRREKQNYQTSEMHIEVKERHQYSTEYIRLTRDFLTIF
jgi:tRNA1Val (adenine37-N6)-methyltransferase